MCQQVSTVTLREFHNTIGTTNLFFRKKKKAECERRYDPSGIT